MADSLKVFVTGNLDGTRAGLVVAATKAAAAAAAAVGMTEFNRSWHREPELSPDGYKVGVLYTRPIHVGSATAGSPWTEGRCTRAEFTSMSGPAIREAITTALGSLFTAFRDRGNGYPDHELHKTPAEIEDETVRALAIGLGWSVEAVRAEWRLDAGGPHG